MKTLHFAFSVRNENRAASFYNKNKEYYMNKQEVLEKAQKKKVYVGEMEKTKINKSCWIGNVCACIIAVILMIIEGALGHYPAIYALGTVCYSWASVFYFCQFFIAKRPKGVLIGGILHGIGAITMLTFYILFNTGVLWYE